MKLSVVVPSLTGERPQGLAEDPRVEIVVVKGVSPVGRARDEGLWRATGDYVAWVDADDEVTENWLDEIWQTLSSRPDVVVLGHEWVQPDGFSFTRVWRGTDLLGDVLAQRGIRSELWNFVVRRALWKGIRFDPAARVLEDWAVVPRLLMRAHSVVSVGKAVYRYRVNASSLTQRRGDADLQRETFARMVAREGQIRSLGLWRRYGRETLIGIANAICLSPGAGAWMRRKLLGVLVSPAPMRQKVKWVLFALGLGRLVKRRYGK